LNTQKTLLNEDIVLHSVRVVDHDGEQQGIMTSAAAFELAQGQGLDLVLISSEATPPVCKIIDWGKYQFENKKRAKESKAKQTVVDTKEVQFRPTIDIHDLETKMNKARKFLERGKHVKFVMRFRGRETTHSEIGMDIMKNILESLGDSVVIEKPPLLNGRNIIMLVSPMNK